MRAGSVVIKHTVDENTTLVSKEDRFLLNAGAGGVTGSICGMIYGGRRRVFSGALLVGSFSVIGLVLYTEFQSWKSTTRQKIIAERRHTYQENQKPDAL